MDTQRAVINNIKRFVWDVKQSGIHLHRVILYGSYAQNKQQKWSDIDIALVADEFKSIGFEDVKLFSGILCKYAALNIQPRTYNTNDFSIDKDPFVEEILKTGIEIES